VELQAADPLVRGELLARLAQDREGGVPARRVPRRELHEGLGDREAQRVGRGHDRRLGDRFVLQQDAFELEGRDEVVDRDLARVPSLSPGRE
jgi:hypothetical protein